MKASGYRKRLKIMVYYAFIFFFFLVLLHGLPMTVDDLVNLNLQIDSTGDMIQYSLHYGNGRFLGNFGILFLLAHPVLADLIRAGVLTGIVFLLPEVLNVKKREICRLLAFLLVIGISPGIFGQTFSWLTGFQNYTPPILLALLGLYLTIQASRKRGFIQIVLLCVIFLTGVCMQLYVEHSSCLNVLFLSFLSAKAYRMQKPERKTLLVFTIGALLGLFIMLVLPQLLNKTDPFEGYRSIYWGGNIQSLIYGISRNAIILIGMYSENAIAFLILSFFVLLIIINEKTYFSYRQRFYFSIGLSVPTIVCAVSSSLSLHPWYGKLAITESIILLGAVVLLSISILLFIFLIRRKENGEKYERSGLLLLFAVVSILPLLMVWPTGYRCLLHSYFFLAAGILILADSAILELELKGKETKQIIQGCKAIIISFCIVLIVLFCDIRRVYAIREAFIRDRIYSGAETIAYYSIPSPYIHDYYLEGPVRMHYQILYGRDVHFEIRPAEIWFRENYYGYE